MFKKLGLPAIVLGTALSLLAPTGAMARDHDHWRHEHRGPRFSIYYGPSYAYGPAYANGFYDSWGVWHPYGRYDRWGRFHPY